MLHFVYNSQIPPDTESRKNVRLYIDFESFYQFEAS